MTVRWVKTHLVGCVSEFCFWRLLRLWLEGRPETLRAVGVSKVDEGWLRWDSLWIYEENCLSILSHGDNMSTWFCNYCTWVWCILGNGNILKDNFLVYGDIKSRRSKNNMWKNQTLELGPGPFPWCLIEALRLRIHHSKFDPSQSTRGWGLQQLRYSKLGGLTSCPIFFGLVRFCPNLSESPWVCTTEEFEIKSSHSKKTMEGSRKGEEVS